MYLAAQVACLSTCLDTAAGATPSPQPACMPPSCHDPALRASTPLRCAAGSSIALNKLPPESVAKMFPRRANTLLYTAPPPAPSPPPLPSSPYMVSMHGGRNEGGVLAGWMAGL